MKTLSFFYCLFFETMPGIFGILGSVFFIILTIDDVISISKDKNIAVSLFTFILCIFMNTFCIVKIILCIYASSFCILTSISKIFMNTIIIHIREQCMHFRYHLKHIILRSRLELYRPYAGGSPLSSRFNYFLGPWHNHNPKRNPTFTSILVLEVEYCIACVNV